MPIDRVSELLSRMARLIAADGYERGLKPVQWQALRFLASANRFSRTPGGMTAWLGQTKGSVSQTIAVLVGKGLIDRSEDQKDRRVVRLNLTVAGQALVCAPPIPSAEDMLEVLSDEDRLALGMTLEMMLRGHLAKRGDRPFGLCANCMHFGHKQGGGTLHRCRLLMVDLSDNDAARICIEQQAA